MNRGKSSVSSSTSSAGLVELAERVEAATPDVGASLALVCLEDEVKRAMWEQFHIAPQPFLHSLDAAMTLVPEGFMWRVQSDPDGVVEALAEKGAGDFGAIDARHTQSFAETPALALCAAALRARAAQDSQQ